MVRDGFLLKHRAQLIDELNLPLADGLLQRHVQIVFPDRNLVMGKLMVQHLPEPIPCPPDVFCRKGRNAHQGENGRSSQQPKPPPFFRGFLPPDRPSGPLFDPLCGQGGDSFQFYGIILNIVQQIGNFPFHTTPHLCKIVFSLIRPRRSLLLTVDSFKSKSCAICATFWA